MEYLCKSYMHHGKNFCPSHRIREAELDTQVQQYAENLRNQWIAEQADLQRLYRKWLLKQPTLDRAITQLREEIRQHEEEIDELLMLHIQSTK